MTVDGEVSTEIVRPQDRVLALMGRAFEFRQLAEVPRMISTLEEALSEARKTPYEIEFQTRIQLGMTLADSYLSVGETHKASEMLSGEAAFAERISSIMQATGNQDQKRAATSGFLQIRDRSIQVGLLGKQTPEISVKHWLQGSVESLASLRGKVVLLEFWATWCKPCQEMFPKLKTLHESEGPNGLEVVALTRHYLAYGGTAESLEEERQLMLGMVKKHDANFHVGLSEDEKLQTAFGANGLPTLILIDRESTVRYAGPGEDDLSFNKELQQALGR
jgi:thiol-disulfide isomerase/thioredoxin